jgi:16S rRNA processing protein RimM
MGSAAGTTAAGVRVELGRVRQAQGLRGALLIELFSADPTTLLRAREVTLDGDHGAVPFQLRRARSVGARSGRARVVLELSGLDARARAERWVGSLVCVSAADLPRLPEGEYYQRDLLGLRCVCEERGLLGSIHAIESTSAADLLIVRGPGGRELRIPAEDGILLRIEREAGRVVVRLPEGFLLAGDE